MAASTPTNVSMALNAICAAPTNTACDATDGLLVTPTAADQKLLIIVENSDAANAETVTIAAGTGPMAAGAYAFSVAASTTKYLVLESGRYAQSTGKIKITASADVKIGVLQLP